MVSSTSTVSGGIEQLMLAMYQKMSAADTDGITGLSKDELSSIDTGNDVGGARFLKMLSNQFDKIDADGNGQLSSDEIAAARPHRGHMGPPPGLQLESSDSSDDTNSTGSIKDMVEKLFDKVLESMSDGIDKLSSTDSANMADSLTKSADKDNNNSLSASELSSIDTSNDSEKADIVSNLIKNFNKYDTNGDGQLSQSELKAAMPDSELAGDLKSSLSNLSNYVQKFLDKYQSSDLSTWISKLGTFA